MPSGPRIRSNSEFGLITDNPLTAGATTFNSARLALMPVVSAAHAVVTLDPRAQNGEPEIVIITAHTAAATVATISRGAYGTVARSHPVNTEWIHAPVDEDFIEVLTSATRPSDPYGGQLIFETDTEIYVARNAANGAWVEALPIGAWQTWTPTLTNLTLGNGTTTARYTRFGRTIHYKFKFLLGSTSAVGSDPSFTLPVAPNANYVIFADTMGLARLHDVGSGIFPGYVGPVGGSTVNFLYWSASGAVTQDTLITATAPFTWANGDSLMAAGTYEAAT